MRKIILSSVLAIICAVGLSSFSTSKIAHKKQDSFLAWFSVKNGDAGIPGSSYPDSHITYIATGYGSGISGAECSGSGFDCIIGYQEADTYSSGGTYHIFPNAHPVATLYERDTE